MRVGAHGEGIEVNGAPLVAQLGGHFRLRQGLAIGHKGGAHRATFHQLHIPQAAGGGDKVFHIAGNVEAAEVAAQQTIHDRLSPVEDVEHIRRWEGGVVEEGNLHMGHFLPNVEGGEPQVVVVDPDQGILGGILTGSFRKEAVDVLEVLPIGTFVGEMLGKGVEDGPKGFLGGDVVELPHLLGR